MSRSVEQYYRQQRQRKIQAAALAVVFLAVLWFQFGRTTDDTSNATEVTPSVTNVVFRAQPSSETLKPLEETVALPRLSIDEIIVANPFSTPKVSAIIDPEPAPKPVETRSEPIVPPSVAAIYKTTTGWAALVDRQVVRPGDHLSTGHRVLDVTPTGIRVEFAQ